MVSCNRGWWVGCRRLTGGFFGWLVERVSGSRTILEGRLGLLLSFFAREIALKRRELTTMLVSSLHSLGWPF